MGLEARITPKLNVDFAGPFEPSPIGVGKQRKDLKP
jgi:hypothetical protein